MDPEKVNNDIKKEKKEEEDTVMVEEADSTSISTVCGLKLSPGQKSALLDIIKGLKVNKIWVFVYCVFLYKISRGL